MTLRITIRLPGPLPEAAQVRNALTSFLGAAEPAAVLLAETAGAGPVGGLACVTAMRVTRAALATRPH